VREGAINLRQLRYFVKVAGLGNMTKAAEQLNVAQPALGLQVKQLEEELGIALLTRHSRGVVPTPAGKTLFDRAQKILQLVDETRTEILSMHGATTETLRLGLTPSIMKLIGYDLLIEAREEIPQLLVSITEELGFILTETLRRGELDMALIYEIKEEPGYTLRPLFDEHRLYVTSRTSTEAGPITLAEVLQEPLALPCSRDFIRLLLEAAAEQRGMHVKIAFEVNSPLALRAIVLHDTAASVLPFGAIAEEVRNGLVTARPIVDPVFTRRLNLVRPVGGRIFHNEAAIEALMQRMASKLAQSMGELMLSPSKELQSFMAQGDATA
jgi:LysR family nitrogen assimilation transcriptional regulator